MSDKRKNKIAVIGGGLYGVTIATELANRTNSTVDIFEQNHDILMAASLVNQYRLHRGYHYPRSSETTKASLDSQQDFSKLYEEAILKDTHNYYAIARTKSLTTAKQFENFCDIHDLKYKKTSHSLLNSTKIEQVYRVEESLIDPHILRNICWDNLKKSKVRVRLSTTAHVDMLKNYDYVINATYANLNSLLTHIPSSQKNYQFEVCEKIVVQLPNEFKHESFVIMDGQFMCIDPFGKTGLHLLGNVVHAIHHTNVGILPIVPKKIQPFLNQGIIKNPTITNFAAFIESGVEFFPMLDKAKHIGSMFTVRTVLPRKDKTDERPTILKKINSKYFTVFSGKLSNCVQVANELVNHLQ